MTLRGRPVTPPSLSRRRLIALGAAGLIAGPARAAAETAAAIDWAMLETALALGIPMVAGAELVLYRKFVIEPALPPQTADLGLRGGINFEVLRRAAPSLILSSPWYTRIEPNLRRIAPVLSLRIHERGRDPYEAAEAAALELGRRFGRDAAAEALIRETRDELAQTARALAERSQPPLFVITIGDPRHFRVFGDDSMVGAVLKRLGLLNAWARQTSYSVQAPVDIVALADNADAAIAILAPVPDDARRVLPQSAIWQNLPAVRAERVMVLDPVNHFGGLPAARRLGRLLHIALSGGAPGLG
ncbi:ABC transporter substrate-binding protein [Bosea sp. BK604]|uniref:ABC transporter substrate-binding protein n=1 Tax=Bosea sp. BK604 TaxID=2512180 RepID=UPI00104B671C|nr:ABC transporter substrate-binding protein [Bosea sp. BK604]TCR66357.1 iron complex transport system substrate-binding protein [Bosea sp. BK604]